MNKGIIVTFSFLVGCGAATAAYLLYTSKRDSSDYKNLNENENSNENKKAIKEINAIFAKHEEDDDYDKDDAEEMKKSLIDALNEGRSPKDVIGEANNYFEKDTDQAKEDKAKGRSYSINSDFSLASNETIDGGKKTKRVIKRSKKSRSKSRSSSRSKSKIYKKLI